MNERIEIVLLDKSMNISKVKKFSTVTTSFARYCNKAGTHVANEGQATADTQPGPPLLHVSLSVSVSVSPLHTKVLTRARTQEKVTSREGERKKMKNK